MANKTLKIYGKEFTGRATGNKFVAYQFVSEKSGEWFKVKFTRECDNIPTKTGYYLLEVPKENISVQKAPILDSGKKGNRIIWVHKIVSCVKDTASDEANAKRKAEFVEDL